VLDQVEETVSTVAWPIKEQDRHELPFPLCMVCFEDCQKRFGLVEVQGEEGIGKDWSGFWNPKQTNHRTDGKSVISLVADTKYFPEHHEGLSFGVRQVHDGLII